MNYSLTRKLILKDWYLQRWLIVGSFLGGLGALGIVCLGGQLAFMIGLILFVTVLVAAGAQLSVACIVNERKDQTLPFLFSLPISFREYTASKLAGILSIFFLLWACLFGGVCLLFAIPHGIPHGLFPFALIMATEILLNSFLITTVALVTESQKWAISAVMVGNVALNVIGIGVFQLPGIARGFHGTQLMWSGAASAVLATELALILLLVLGCVFLQSRKKDFL
jgi:ABC-2 type transport system permease protein